MNEHKAIVLGWCVDDCPPVDWIKQYDNDYSCGIMGRNKDNSVLIMTKIPINDKIKNMILSKALDQIDSISYDDGAIEVTWHSEDFEEEEKNECNYRTVCHMYNRWVYRRYTG